MIDASIPLQNRPAQIDTPFEMQSKYLTLKQLIDGQKLHQIQMQAAQLELAEKQRAIKEADQLRNIFRQTPDVEKALPQVYGVNPQAGMAMQKNLADMRQKQVELSTKQLEFGAKRAERLASLAGGMVDEDSYHRGIGQAIAEGLLPGQAGSQLLMHPWDEQTQAQVQQFRTQALSAKEQAELKLKHAAEQRAQNEFLMKQDMFPAEMTIKKAEADLKSAESKGQAPVQPYQRAQLEQTAAQRAEAARHNQVTEKQGAARVGLEGQRLKMQADANESILEAPAIDAAAQAVLRGLPVSQAVPGMGKQAAAARAKVLNRVAQIDPSFDIAGAMAGFKADSGSLTSLQKNRDAVIAFENTAEKNLDVFLSSAKKVVDSGSPLLNTPLRAINEKMLGNTDATAFNVARQTAVNEIAKVLNSSNMGGVLSDSARHEVETLIGPNATLKQIYRAAEILKTDMHNRKASLDSQIGEIKGRISKNPPAQQKSDPLGIR